jgi:hypothetical protein
MAPMPVPAAHAPVLCPVRRPGPRALAVALAALLAQTVMAAPAQALTGVDLAT